MTEQEVQDKGLARHVIGKKDKEVTLDKYIFEFNDYGKEHMGAKGYIPHYPGFLNTSVHPSGLCVPCCFKKKQQFADLKTCEDKLRVAKRASPRAEVAEAPKAAEEAPPRAEVVEAPKAAEVVPPPVVDPQPPRAEVVPPPQKAPDEYIVGPD